MPRLASFLSAFAVTVTATFAATAPTDFLVYFGTYAKAPSKGIYRSHFDAATGRLSPAELAAEAKDPAFLALHPKGNVLYAIDESADTQRTPGQGLAAYSIDPKSGSLTLLNRQSTGSSGACHLTVDATGRAILVANYGGGGVSAVALSPDGRLGAVGSVIQHTGSSVNPARQKGPHAHQIITSADNRFAFVPDLGLDRVMVYQIDPGAAKLTAHNPPSNSLAPGSGPRHMTFHPSNQFAYVISEMLCTMTAFRYDSARGTLAEIQTVSTLPPGEAVAKGTSTAEVQVHPSGKFLYGSNRGHNTIVVYAIDPASGKMTYVENVSTQGKTPRHFTLDPTGRWLLAENQDSNTVAVLRIDEKSGRLTPTGTPVEIPVPVSAVFVPTR